MLSSLALPKFSSYNSKSGINLGFFSKGYSKLFRETRCQHQVFGSETDITKIISFGMPENFPSFLFMTTSEKSRCKRYIFESQLYCCFLLQFGKSEIYWKKSICTYIFDLSNVNLFHTGRLTQKNASCMQQPSFKSCLYHTSIKTPKMPLFEENRSLMPFNSV